MGMYTINVFVRRKYGHFLLLIEELFFLVTLNLKRHIKYDGLEKDDFCRLYEKLDYKCTCAKETMETNCSVKTMTTTLLVLTTS